ncbi:fec operon regulator FecR [compost metagenome]
MNRSEPRQEAHTPTDDAIARHRDELKKRFPLPPPRKKPKRHAPGMLGVAVAALALAGGLVWLDPAYRSEQYSSSPGRLETIELADGSIVTLDGASRIRVSWHLRSRRVELQVGQALFDVTPASYRPFLTLAGSTEITVVGTRYNVSRHQGDVRVTVEKGKVGVRGNDAALLLVPGDQVLVRHGRLGMPTRVNAHAVAAWTEGRLVFDRTPLGEVLDVLLRYGNTHVRLGDAGLAELPVSGSFDSARLDGLLALLPKVLPVELATDADGTLSLSRRATKK